MSFPFKIKKEKHLYYLFALVAFAITLFLYLTLKEQFFPLQMKIEHEQEVTDSFNRIIYHDFEGDGISEKVYLMNINHNNRGISSLGLHSNGDALSEFNFVIDHPLKSESIYFHDIGNDFRDDILMFYQNKDSVFLDIIEYKDNFPRSTYFITSKPDSVTHDIWDISINTIGVRKYNGENHLYFWICGWYSKYPRNIYDFNLSKKQIDNVFVTNASFQKTQFFDLNKDGTDEIIISTYSSANISKDKKYNDQHGYLFVLNLELDLLFEPIVNDAIFESVHTTPLQLNPKNYLFLLRPSYGKKNNVRAEIIDKYGKTVIYKDYKAFQISAPFTFNNNGTAIYFVLDDRLLKVDHNLNEISTTEVNDKFSIISKLQLKPFYDAVLLGYDSKYSHSLCLYDANLNKLGQLPLTTSLSLHDNKNRITEMLSNTTDKYLYQINGNKKNILFSIQVNPHAKFIYLYFLLTFIIIFLFISGTHQVSKRISLYLNYFIYSLRKNSAGIVIVNDSGKVIYKNFRLHKILNISENYKKTDYKTLLKPYKELIEIIDSSLENNKEIEQEFTIRKEDKVINGKIRIIPYVSFFKLTYAYTIEISDFSEMLVSDRMKSWSSTAQKIAHDIKTPLSTIQLNLKAIQRRMEKEGVPNQEIYNEDISRIRDELERIKTLSKNFLKFANLDKPDSKKVNIGKLIKKSFNQFEDYIKENVQVEYNFDEDAKYVWADPNQLEQLFHVLIENSIDSMKGEGTIRISCCLVQQLQQVNERWIEIEFSDNGSGISEDNLSKVFEPYFTTKVDGTGFGLALAHKIVKDHNGKINIYSKENMGTTIRILLPAVEESGK